MVDERFWCSQKSQSSRCTLCEQLLTQKSFCGFAGEQGEGREGVRVAAAGGRAGHRESQGLAARKGEHAVLLLYLPMIGGTGPRGWS